MEVQWYGQSAFRLSGEQGTVAVDPFGSLEGLTQRGLRFEYPPIEGLSADLLLITHEHLDHNAAEVVGGSPQTIRSTAGRFNSRFGEVVAVAAEHDPKAGTERGPNTIFCFSLDGVRCCHLGDFGQAQLRAEQREAIGPVDLLFVPVGGGPTINGNKAWEVAKALAARWVVPMHYNTPRIGFLEGPEAFFAAAQGQPKRSATPLFRTEELPAQGGLIVPAVP